ncbi:glycoprotein-N-acetylgalactosamine 3-beta-galactosyltransferase 1 [Eurytemora carolleeae]|uniref:glycoprotein-N-acetylgalactosamine 3-beta-galactosyltransferase 1 n=1 Tax=Eurytemora carolleeae TaxID=1294199 RepID=UPI000C78208B|nr:glycoprotein-N-acetylgalactosamine 3-beta-galactosyltransferase 1 [Eurytemora carolleeae]|eukprot:XP_023323047.1 glycoprotein-N-acetylgalactosamine 3-beta-galactosyltransferase 1-like [Eurytemora affinis]
MTTSDEGGSAEVLNWYHSHPNVHCGMRAPQLVISTTSIGKPVDTISAFYCFICRFMLMGIDSVKFTQFIVESSQNFSISETKTFELESETDSVTNYKYHLGSEFVKFKATKSPLRKVKNTVYDTWGSRCTFLYFISTESEDGDHGLPVLHNPAEENYGNLWSKTKYGFQFAFDYLLDQVDWVMKADDDTYVIMENLHNMLAQHDPEFPTFFGQHFGISVDQGYMSGGSGYILSRKAVEILVTKAFTNSSLCRENDDGYEDVEMGSCLSKIGVKPSDSRDKKRNEETFFPAQLWDMLSVSNTSWLQTYMSKKPVAGFDCCSEYAISFHYVTPQRMYEMEYVIYKLKLVDIKEIRETLRERLKDVSNSPLPS